MHESVPGYRGFSGGNARRARLLPGRRNWRRGRLPSSLLYGSPASVKPGIYEWLNLQFAWKLCFTFRARGGAMIHEVEGDILLSDAAAIAHGVAANDPMNQGLAAALHKNFPSMHKDFHHWCHIQHPKTGDAWIWSGTNGARVVNLITQEGGHEHGSKPGKASVSSVNHALRSLKKLMDEEGISSVALPRLATGVGGLDWSDVRPLIQSQLGDVAATIYVYSQYTPGKKAHEPTP